MIWKVKISNRKRPKDGPKTQTPMTEKGYKQAFQKVCSRSNCSQGNHFISFSGSTTEPVLRAAKPTLLLEKLTSSIYFKG